MKVNTFAAVACLLVAAASAAAAGPCGAAAFFSSNPFYAVFAETFPELLEPGTEVTLLLPVPSNYSGSDFKQRGLSADDLQTLAPRLGNFILPAPLSTVGELLAAGEVQTFSNTTASIVVEEGGAVAVEYEATVGTRARAVITPVALPVGSSFVYLTTEPTPVLEAGTELDGVNGSLGGLVGCPSWKKDVGEPCSARDECCTDLCAFNPLTGDTWCNCVDNDWLCLHDYNCCGDQLCSWYGKCYNP